MEKLVKVDKPTVKITGQVERFDQRETGFSRAYRGDFGARAQRGMDLAKNPLNLSVSSVFSGFPPVDRSASPMRAPDTRGGTSYQDYLPDDPGILSRNIKSLGYFVGADVMGICRLPGYALYSHDKAGHPVNCEHENAIAIVADQDYKTLDASSGADWISSVQSYRAYSFAAYIAMIVADYVRQLGYAARVNHAQNYQVVVPPLLMLAGIGEIARNGIVLNPFIGMRFKAAVVTTDMPLEPDKPVDFGLQDFCQKCKKCAVECPAQAISYADEKIPYNGYERYEFHVERCTRFRLTNPRGLMCGRCIKVCPWNKSPGIAHDLVRWSIQNLPFLNSAWIKLDDLFGYGKVNDDEKWWFDFVSSRAADEE